MKTCITTNSKKHTCNVNIWAFLSTFGICSEKIAKKTSYNSPCSALYTCKSDNERIFRQFKEVAVWAGSFQKLSTKNKFQNIEGIQNFHRLTLTLEDEYFRI